MKDLYGIEEKKKSLLAGALDKCYCFTKDYFGAVPITGGVIMTGTLYTLLYTVGAAHHISENPADFLNASGYGDKLAAEWARIGFPAGQFLTYTAKKRIGNMLKDIFGKGGEKNG